MGYGNKVRLTGCILIVGVYVKPRPKCFVGARCSYDAPTKVLTVEFTAYRKALHGPPFTGRPYKYTYEDVDQDEADHFFDNDEDGTYWNYNIRGQPLAYANYTRIS